jgi:hypothetical protein
MAHHEGHDAHEGTAQAQGSVKIPFVVGEASDLHQASETSPYRAHCVSICTSMASFVSSVLRVVFVSVPLAKRVVSLFPRSAASRMCLRRIGGPAFLTSAVVHGHSQRP